MQASADGRVPSPSGDRNESHHSIVSELVSLIEHVQAGMQLLEAAIARETALDNQDAAGNVFVLDDVTPPLREGEHHVERLQCRPWRCPSLCAGSPGTQTSSLRFHGERSPAGSPDQSRLKCLIRFPEAVLRKLTMSIAQKVSVVFNGLLRSLAV